MGLLHSCSPHSDAAGGHLAPVCSRKLEGNCGNHSLLDTSGGTLQNKLGRGGETLWRSSALQWDSLGAGAPEFMNTMPLSLEHDGLGRCCSPVTAAWTMRPQHTGTWSQYGRRSSPLQLHPYHMYCQQPCLCSGEAVDGDVLHLEPVAPLS